MSIIVKKRPNEVIYNYFLVSVKLKIILITSVPYTPVVQETLSVDSSIQVKPQNKIVLVSTR